jgi:chromosome segregation ATPase
VKAKFRLLLAAMLLISAGASVAIASRAQDRARAEALLAELSAVPAHEKLAKEPMDEARRALSRARDAQAAGDSQRAALLEALGREWAETASELVRAAKAEQKLASTQKELGEVETRLTRARALLEESVARRGRAQAKLEELGQDAGAPATDGGQP